MPRANDVLQAALSPLVKSNCWPLVKPKGYENVTPYIVYTPIVNNRQTSLKGYTGNNNVFFQVDIYTEAFNECRNLGEEVIAALEAAFVNNCLIDADRDEHDTTTNLFRKSMDFQIWEQTT